MEFDATQKARSPARIVALAGSVCLAACGGSGTPTPTPTPSTANRAPVVGSVVVSPTGIGIDSATIFTFTAQGVSDPDGDSLTYSWSTSDGAPAVSATAALAHVFMRTGTFDVRVTVTDPKGLSTSASMSVTIGNITGTWDVTCAHAFFPFAPLFPAAFVVSITQSGSLLFGTITGGGLSQSFPAPPSVGSVDAVRDPKRASFGVETAFNRWAPNDGDFYFNLTANDTLTSMSGSGQYCSSSVATRR
jgi:hypothetical protein